MRRFLACVLLLACTAAAPALELIRDRSLDGAWPALPAAGDDLWRSRTMVHPDKPGAAQRVWSGPDFFTDEYGRPCRFDEDLVARFGYASGAYAVAGGALAFTAGAKGFAFGFGAEPGNPARAPIRLGFNWGRNLKDKFRLAFELEQDAPTEWTFETVTPDGRAFAGSRSEFAIAGSEVQRSAHDVGLVRILHDGFPAGFRLTCRTPGASVRLRSLHLAPSSSEVFFRRTVEIAHQPWRAHVSFAESERYALYINGERVAEGDDIYPSGLVRSVDIARHLRTGANQVAMVREWQNWNDGGCAPELLLEGVSVGTDGSIVRIVSDDRWRCAQARSEGWERPSFDDSAWAVPRLTGRSLDTDRFDGKRIFLGINPRFMGALRVRPADRQHPVFGREEAKRFIAAVPAAMGGAWRPRLALCRAGSDEELRTFDPLPDGAADADGPGTHSFHVAVEAEAPGPYRLLWTLRDAAGAVVETRREELVVLGPVAQESFTVDAFERELASRLEPVADIDCTAAAPDDGSFIDHAGMYASPAIGKGRVTRAGEMAYRETGKERWDYFAYRLPQLEKGVPHLAVVEVPDDRDRYVYAGVMESYPLHFMNNVPNGSTGWYTATASCYTGVRFPLSLGWKRLEFAFYPQSDHAALAVMSGFAGSPAAAGRIRIFRVRGGLPALDLPPSQRLFGSHLERMSAMRLTVGMAENPLACDRGIASSGHVDCYRTWYQAIARRIALLRFQGYNASVEGAYMYREGEFPSRRHNRRFGDGDGIDPMALLLEMYRRNGITAMLGMEYIASPQMALRGLAGVSERRLWDEGAPTTRLVDRHGRQQVGYFNGGYNFLDPQVEAELLGCIGELRARYRRQGGIHGLFLVHGFWWLPTFNAHAYRDVDDLDIGYDDATVARFERECGISLGIEERGRRRFELRHQAIYTRHLRAWVDWRARRTEAFLGAVERLVRDDGGPAWKLVRHPDPGVFARSPQSTALRPEVDADGHHPLLRLLELGTPAAAIAGGPGSTLAVPVACWSKFASPDEDSAPVYAWNSHPQVRQAIEDAGAVYARVCNGLDEVDSPAGAARRWICARTARGVFTPRAAGECAYSELVEAVAGARVPELVLDQWIDCNLDTGAGPQVRRFAAALCAVPAGARFAPVPAGTITGLPAHLAVLADGRTILRLVNDTPHPASGAIALGGGAARDLASGREWSGRAELSLPPFAIAVLDLGRTPASPGGSFAFPAAAAAALTGSARDRLALCERAGLADDPAAVELRRALAAGDVRGLWRGLHAGDAGRRLGRIAAMAAVRTNQALLLADLAAGGARIDCGAGQGHVDGAGRRWLPDQEFLAADCGYGRASGEVASRGAIPIAGTDAPEVHRSEVYGDRVRYVVPLPAGRWLVRCHFAETHAPNTRPGMRSFRLAVAGAPPVEGIDIVARSGGQRTALVIDSGPVALAAPGPLEIALSGNACINGIEIVPAAER
ncbi:MAG: hypothetical protein L6R48_00490 [Planctomycetes bacterium]|nr:hypothetical protein [Planctomycetota bacterium]